MNLKNKLYFLFIFLSLIFINNVSATDLILPKLKPINNELNKLTNNIVPLKKPSSKVQIKSEFEKSKKTNLAQKSEYLLPKKKPLIFKNVKMKVAYKSKYYSKKDFNIAKKTITLMEKRKWKEALKIAKKAKDKTIYKFIQWKHLITNGNRASYYDYLTFINQNPNFPRIGRLKYLSEHKLSTKKNSYKKIIQLYSKNMPLSGYGKLILGESKILNNEIETGIQLIKDGWITASLSKQDLRYFRKKYKKYLSSEDYIKRADWLSWENKYWDLKRLLRYLPKGYQELYQARQLLMTRSYGVDTAIAKVPKKFKNDPGLQYDRLKWRRKRGRLDSSVEILLEIKNNKDYLIRPDKWWVERSIIARSLIYKKKYELAYKITSNHGMVEGPEFAEAEWLSGWIALVFLDDPILAVGHFQSFYDNVGYPISLSRGAYWLARTYKKLKNNKSSLEWYSTAAKYLTTYYGQLAYMELYPNEEYSLIEQVVPNIEQKKKFYRNELTKIVILLHDLNKDEYSKDILKHLANYNIAENSETLAANLSTEIGRYDYAIQISKTASYEKRFINDYNFPIISTPDKINNKKMPSQEIILAIIRQESEFDSEANSSAGAKGMMQLMTYTAKLVSKQAKLSYSKSKLTKNPDYNIHLGSYYFATLLEEFDGSYPFAIAGYNAGPKRVRYWKKINKNPQKNQIDYVNWIELIKFKETRNYVQRVLENINVYNYMLSKKPVKMINFFKDYPLF